MSSLGDLRLVHAKGMRASLGMLLRDHRLRDRSLVEEHYEHCKAMITSLEEAAPDAQPSSPGPTHTEQESE